MSPRKLLLIVVAFLGGMLQWGFAQASPREQMLEKARADAERGDPMAQWLIGGLYERGEDYAEAIRWYRKAADQGFADAECSLGSMYSKGRGVRQDYAEAARWFRKAADQRYELAQYELGVYYANGLGVPQNFVQAHMWLNLAASRATGKFQKKSAESRDKVASFMTRQQVAEAQRLALEWKPSK
jgi:uncharacterized protein